MDYQKYFNKLFSNLKFKHVEEKGNHSVYAARIRSGIEGNKQRYVLLFVPIHSSMSGEARIYQLNWKNIQFRMVEQELYRLGWQEWIYPKKFINPLFTKRNVSKNESFYTCDNFPMDLTLFHQPKKGVHQYPSSINLYMAIDKFNTMFSIPEGMGNMYQNMNNYSSHTPHTQNDDVIEIL